MWYSLFCWQKNVGPVMKVHACMHDSLAIKVSFVLQKYVMAGKRGQFFTVSEALQAILDQGSDGDEHVWDDDDDVDSPPTTTLPLSPIPSTSREAVVQAARRETPPRSSTPKRKHAAGSYLPTPKRHSIGSTQPSITAVSDDESLTEVSLSNPTSLADKYLASNPALETEPVNEVTTIEYVHSKISKGCGCTRKCFE